MASQFDDSDFVDRDYQSSEVSYGSGAPGSGRAAATLTKKPPTRQELETRVTEAQRKLTELRRAQEELERERAALEDARRRRVEFQTGREEMLQHLTRGVTLLEQAEFAARRDAEQMAKSLTGLRDALVQVQAIQDEAWNQENWNTELTKALAAVENARMEWNASRLKWPLLNGEGSAESKAPSSNPASFAWPEASFPQLCRMGLALTWPIAAVAFLSLLVLLFIKLR